jgi:methylglutaconyl-CoA hydratase
MSTNIFNTIEYLENGKLAVLKLSRPDKLNAIDAEMIVELKQVFDSLKNNNELVVLQVVGKGKAFCSGADIAWLESLNKSDNKLIEAQFSELAEMLAAMYSLPQLVISLVHGSVFGGGLGLMTCSDFVISSPGTVFSFSEIKLGLIPATISPYVVHKTGIRKIKKMFYTGERFDEIKALQIGLIDQIAQGDLGELHYETLMETLLKQPHHALKAMKTLLRGLESGNTSWQNQEESIKLIAKLVSSDETQKLLERFLAGKKN